MISSLLGTIMLWTLALLALGWLFLPVSRRIFGALPDGGLATGRVLFVILAALFAFWGANLHLIPLRLAPAVAALAALMCAAGWRDAATRNWARENWRALAVSDAMFLGSWALFLWVRVQHPEINDLEKPMDAALLSAAWKADWLPFAHPWWGGANFTNYYYFGPFMGALMGRALGAPPHLAYNLVQPAFCAFFLSTTWALSAALTRSKAWGIVAMLLVGLSGTLEPLRQWSQKGWSWPFDWFATSRVIPNTINEYPAFTMAIGDAHAHFYALSFAALWLCLAWSLFKRDESSEFTAPRRVIIVIGGLVLGAWLMTNTWDAPIFGLLFGFVIWQTRGRMQTKTRISITVGLPFVVAIAASALYFRSFRSPLTSDAIYIGSVRIPAIANWHPWLPDALSFALLWGGWIVLGAIAFLLPGSSHGARAGSSDEASARFRRAIIGAGLLALTIPFLFYIKDGFSGGELRHQNTIFKFGLQAWLLLGLGLSAELGARIVALGKAPKLAAALALIGLAPVLTLASASTIWARALTQSTAPNLGRSLDGMRYLPQAEQRAIIWLQHNGRAGEIVMESVQWKDGALGGDYDANWGYIGAFSGLSSTLGWPQHVWGWDGNYAEVAERGQRIAALYRLPGALETARGGAQLGARTIYFGHNEPNWQTPDANEARAAGFAVHDFSGDDGSRALILERIGR